MKKRWFDSSGVNLLNSQHRLWKWDNLIENKLKKKHEAQISTNSILKDEIVKFESNKVNPQIHDMSNKIAITQ
jgi:hypothetical protein